MSFSFDFIDDLVTRSAAGIDFEERLGDDDGPFSSLRREGDPSADAGFVRLWAAKNSARIDRMIHVRLLSDPVDTQLFFIF